MSLANLSVAYTRMREAIKEVTWKPGDFPEFKHILYCRWCGFSQKWVAKHGHDANCPCFQVRDSDV